MARPIKDTPILTGKDAKRFRESIKNVRRVPKEELKEQKEVYAWFKSIATFPMP
jgi:F420-0:gamma-glutamyl ligase-like protein